MCWYLTRGEIMKIRVLVLTFLVVIAALPVLSQSNGIGPGKTPHPIIKNKPEPAWPKSIKKKLECTIVLRAVFSADAHVTNIRFIEMRPESLADLSEAEVKELKKASIQAARKIKFIPATKDGHPVSMWIQLE